MADTTLPAVTAEVTLPTLEAHKGHVTATSLQVAEHFGKRHTHVLRAIKNLDIPDDYRQPNFGLTINRVPGPKGALRDGRSVVHAPPARNRSTFKYARSGE